MILPFLIALLATWVGRHQEQVIRYLHEENRILKAKFKGRRIQLTDTERRRLAVLAHPIDRKHLRDSSTIATPGTLQRWYRHLIVQEPSHKLQGRPLGRPRVAAEIEQLVVRMANENPRWGYRRIQGALSNLGHHIDNTTVRNILRRNHIDPAPIQGKVGMSWSQFVRLHWDVLAASGFFEAQLLTVAQLWSVMAQVGRNPGARGAQLLGLIRHGAFSVLALVPSRRALCGPNVSRMLPPDNVRLRKRFQRCILCRRNLLLSRLRRVPWSRTAVLQEQTGSTSSVWVVT